MSTIHTDDRYAFSEDQLLTEVFKFADTSRFGDLHIMCGHFMLFFDSCLNTLIPGIFEDISYEPLRSIIKDRVGIFPSYSWDLGVKISDIYTEINNLPASLILLINDWQYTPTKEASKDLRGHFYSTFNALPERYENTLKRSSFTDLRNISASRKHSLCFPETRLKNRFQNEASRLVKQGKLQSRYLPGQPYMSEISFTDSMGDVLPLVSCGITACAGEITEMISEIYKNGARQLVLLAPTECHNAIRRGVEIALTLYKFEPMKILVADLGGAGESTEEEIYGRGVHVATYSTMDPNNEE
ncbi:hypothetical protein IAE33_004164 [Pseudomonas sp. S60]|uniref:hypothetical protein n=1 Tax=Pseudomonas sp. S60 TaxID=211124 RepID=UPI0019134E5B|nr:hypothetical protein [Pseudomonas sp. S60]MBK5012304.1 hypothetical protein [Pseudomonas sp. S60]